MGEHQEGTVGEASLELNKPMEEKEGELALSKDQGNLEARVTLGREVQIRKK